MVVLDESQKEIAFASKNARQLVMAGPGTGKTELVAQRIDYLMGKEGLKPGELLVLSFSRSAVKVLTSRIRSLNSDSCSSLEDLRHVSIRTFDSWTYRMLRFLGFSVADCLNRGYESNIENLSGYLKQNGIKLIRSKHNCGLHRINHIMVDELQDLSGVRADLVISLLKLLCPDSDSETGFTLLGDMNQAIYDFTYRENRKGMSSDEFIKCLFVGWKNSLNKRKLQINYRSGEAVTRHTKKIADIIQQSADKKEDPLPAIKRLLDTLPVSKLSSVLDSVDNSTAVLCRNNGQALLIGTEILSDAHNFIAKKVKLQSAGNPGGLPYWLGALLSLYKGSAPLTKNDVGKIISALKNRDIELPYDTKQYWALLTRIMGVQESTGISMDDLMSRLSWPDSLPDDIYEDKDEIIMLTTVHQSKGQEFDKVYVLREGLAKQTKVNKDPAEEARITYVASGRARSDLSLIKNTSLVSLKKRKLENNTRERWHGIRINHSRGSKSFIHHLEIGIGGDLDDYSFVDTRLFNGETAVNEFQKYLAVNALSIKGEKVILRKYTVSSNSSGKVIYRLYMVGQEGEKLIGITNEQLSLDLLSVKPLPDLKLPREIFGLRISGVYSFISDKKNRLGIADPFSISGIWLCVSVYGIGQYEYYF